MTNQPPYMSDDGRNIWGPTTRVGFDISANRFQDDETYRSGGIAWVSQVRRSSHARTEGALPPPPHEVRRASLGTERPLMMGSLYKSVQSQPLNNFTGPSVSVLDQFGNLGEATRTAELRRAMGDLSVDGAQRSPLFQRRVVSSPFGTSQSRLATSAAAGVAPGSGSSTATPASATSPRYMPSPSTSPAAAPLKLAPHAGKAPRAFVPGSSAATPPAVPVAATPKQPHAGYTPPAHQGANGLNATPGSSKRWKRNKKFDSPLLETLRSKNGPLEIKDTLGNVLKVSTDQYGSRFIQENLSKAPPAVRDQFFSEASTHCLSLMTDVFGNYVIQQLFELGTPGQRAEMVSQMRGHVVALSLQMYGCRVVQMAIKYSPLELQLELVSELRSHVVRCIKDHNGNHVIQKSVECLPPANAKFIYDDLMTATIELSQHTYGCRVVQRILEYGDANTKEKLLAQLRPQIRKLTEDQYGNYIIQHIVDRGPVDERERIFKELSPSAVLLSSHKFASNVIEKCFVAGTQQQRSVFIDEMLASDKGGSPAIIGMIKDQYANYVVQKILDTAKGDEYARLITAIRPHLASLKRSSYGKHLASVERLLNVC